MKSKIPTQCLPTINLLSREQIETIHRASLEVLEKAGVWVMHEGAREMMAAAGCPVQPNGRVQIPAPLVEECIKSVPSQITMYNRQATPAMLLEKREIYYGLGTNLLETVDLDSGEPRPSTLKDIANAAILIDYCSEVDFGSLHTLTSDAPPPTAYVHGFRAQVENSLKPILFASAGLQDLEAIIEIASVVAGGPPALQQRPFLIHYLKPPPPSIQSYDIVEKMLLCAERGVPVCYSPAAIRGATSPVSIAGEIVQASVQVLSALVIHQLAAKGAPIICGFGLSPGAVKAPGVSFSAPAQRLANSALSNLCHYYEIPTWSTIGSDVHCMDEQAAAEQGMLILTAALDGANLIHNVGCLGKGLLGHPAMIVMSNEVISYIRGLVSGFDFSRGMQAIEVLHAVDPAGDFLPVEHTLKNFRELLWQPEWLGRDYPPSWRASGGRTYGKVLVEQTKSILASHRPDSLPEPVQAEIEAIVRRFDRTLAQARPAS